MNILALDFGTRTGMAVWAGNQLVSGSCEFTKTARAGERFCAFRSWLTDLVETNRINHIVYEKPLGRWAKSQAQTDLSIGFKTILEMVAFENNVSLEPVFIATLKKFTTGNGKADKAEMVAAIKKLFDRGYLTVKDHDEADALALLRYARRNEQVLHEGHVWKTEKGDPF